MPPSLPVVALVGRTNVGKSTLFNAISEARTALVSAIAGTTRDPNSAEIQWRDRLFRLVDTGGLEQKPTTEIEREIQRTALLAAEEADVACLVIDGKAGVSAEDRAIAQRLRKRGIATIIVVNKVDSPKEAGSIDQSIYRLGFADTHTVSAKSGMGIGDLLDVITSHIPHTTQIDEPRGRTEVTLGIIGKTNTGKSTIMNALLGTDRFIASAIPHTTREPRDAVVQWHGKSFRFIDTAGLRKEKKVSDSLERAANLMTGTAIEKQVDIAVIVTDVTKEISMHDLHVVELAVKAKRGIIIVANKWDLIKDKTATIMNDYRDRYRVAFAMIPWAPILFTSGINRQRIIDLFPLAMTIRHNQLRVISDDAANHFLHRLLLRHPPGTQRDKKTPRLYDLRQESTAPQRFRLTVNEPRTVAPAYMRYLERRFRMEFDFTGVPLTFRLTTRKA